MMKKTVLFLLLCMAAAPGLSQTLTLDECRAAAEEHNRTLKNSRLGLDAALQTRREAFTTYFPQVSASGGVFQAQHGLVQADFAIPQMGSLPLSLVKRGILGSVTAVQPLFAGLKIVSGNKLARLGEEVAQLQLQKTAAEVRERTDTYFWQVVSLRDNLSTIEAVERQLAEIHRQVALSVEAGLVTTNDLLRVELRRQEVASERLKVENGLKVSKMLLAQHIGADWHTFDIAAAAFGEPEAPAAYYVPVDEALDRRAEYLLSEKNVEAQKYRKRMERGKRLPTVAVGAGYLYYNVTDKDVDDGMVFAQVSIPISDWWGGAHALKRPASTRCRPRTTDWKPAKCSPWRSNGHGARCRRPTHRSCSCSVQWHRPPKTCGRTAISTTQGQLPSQTCSTPRRSTPRAATTSPRPMPPTTPRSRNTCASRGGKGTAGIRQVYSAVWRIGRTA